LNRVSNLVVGAAIEVHRTLGPGLLESVYEQCLEWELVQHKLMVERQVELPLRYKGTSIQAVYRLDLLIQGELIIEVKAVEALQPVHTAQLLSYLKLKPARLGLLLNFNVDVMRNGIKRVVNDL
jgi:GxxExxY protein